MTELADDELTIANSDEYCLGLCAAAAADRAAAARLAARLADAARLKRWHHILHQATGSTPPALKKDHGHRNHFCTVTGTENDADCLAMTAAGLMLQMSYVQQTNKRTYQATRAGCLLINLHPPAIRRATGAQPPEWKR
jgi:hypothetical protein